MDTSTTPVVVTNTQDTRNNRIGIMLQVLNQLMEDCETHKIEWNTLCNAATSMWGLRNGKDAWDCGRVEDAKKTEVVNLCPPKL